MLEPLHVNLFGPSPWLIAGFCGFCPLIRHRIFTGPQFYDYYDRIRNPLTHSNTSLWWLGELCRSYMSPVINGPSSGNYNSFLCIPTFSTWSGYVENIGLQ